MLRHLLLTLAFVLTTSLLVFSQTGSGTLKGKVVDKQTKEPIPFANIVIELGGVQVGGATTDFDGNYLLKPIPPGKIDLKASYVGYKPMLMKGIQILPDKIAFQDLALEQTATNLQEVQVVDYKVPLISKDQTTSGGTVTSDEIAKMANRSAEAVATTVGGVTTNANGEITSLRGARASGTVYFIDGMRVTGSTALPQSAIEQVEVILGGTPAAYGDATGGIISVTTKGPSKDFNGGIDLQTSQFLDAFGYNRLGLNFTGPLISKKDTVKGTKTPIMGFFIAGDFIYTKDGAPAAYPLNRVNDNTLDFLKTNPLRLYGQSQGVFYNNEFLTPDNFEKTKSSLNSKGYNINISGKLDFRISRSINFSFGGTFAYNNTRNFSFYNSLMDWNGNSMSQGYTWRVNARFTQRFLQPQDSKAFIKNMYYSIGADFTRNYGETQDPTLQKDLFKYGYVGSFQTHKIRTYSPDVVYDSIARKWAHVQNNTQDTIVVFKPSDINPESSAWTSQYYGFFNDPTGHYDNMDNIISGRGLINGMQPTGAYSMFATAGDHSSGYGKNTNDQIAVNASFAADLGNHEIQIGLQYQQRTSRAVSYNGVSLWPLMRGLTNFQLAQLDKSNPQLVYRDGVFMDTINYFRKYDQSSQRNFDINLRKKLGLPVDGTDLIDIDSYDFANNTINFYDKNMKLHTTTANTPIFSLDMLSADELLNNGGNLVSYYGYDYTGSKTSGQPAFEDFFTATDANGNFTRPIGVYRPIYMAGYIQDKFAFKDLIFNIGIRVDRFDANQMVLKDPYLFYPAYTVSSLSSTPLKDVLVPNTIGGDYVVYVDDIYNPTNVTGYRSGNIWYTKDGTPVSDPRIVDPTGVKPYLIDPGNQVITGAVFQQYSPQTNVMPRISFSFPISDDALFYAHYDILTQRPLQGQVQINPIRYLFISTTGSNGTISNPNLRPDKTIDYELGFQQKINNASSLKLSAFYREFRDQIQQYRLSGAYPKTYYSYNNIDFGTVKGLTLVYDLRRTGNARIRFNYTLQFATGTGSDADAASGIIRSDQPNLRTLNPLSFDRRHQFNISVDYRWGSGKDYNGPVINRKKKGKPPVQFLSNFGGNLTITGGSGTPYTKSSKILPFGAMGPIQGSINGARLPWQFLLNFRLDKEFDFALSKKKQGSFDVYLEINNLLNTKNVTYVYPATGSPSDDGYLTAPEWQTVISQQVDPQAYRDMYTIQMTTPYNYSSPRTIRLGLMFNF